ncbi:hypothetical protein [Mangrovicoccus sp. HB161399]|uniref:hypothetical protein n=1 Tax=Mangrovicoccus sp. HB161399 TaxID=2720392 RepID=UPI0015529AEA|nr:hypothetical protein [Mangrovicoccus sp. HB161399]
MQENRIGEMSGALSAQLHAKLGLAHAGLGEQVRGIGRRVPRRVRRALQEIAEAERLSENPRLQSKVDLGRLEGCYRRAHVWLSEYDPARHRAQAWRALAAELAFNLLLGIAAVIAVLAILGMIGPDAR